MIGVKREDSLGCRFAQLSCECSGSFFVFSAFSCHLLLSFSLRIAFIFTSHHMIHTPYSTVYITLTTSLTSVIHRSVLCLKHLHSLYKTQSLPWFLWCLTDVTFLSFVCTVCMQPSACACAVPGDCPEGTCPHQSSG